MDPEKIRRRVEKIPTSDLLTWAENSAAGQMRYLDDYRRSPDEAYLGEIALAALSMQIVVEVLGERVRNARNQVDLSGS